MTKPRTGINKNCLYCNKSYYIKPYLIPTSKYCSKRCKALSTTIKFTANCAICNKEFEHISSRCNKAKYCSQICAKKSLKGKGGKEFKCQYCFKIFRDSPGRNRKFCSRICINKINKKEWKARFTTIRKIMIKRGMINECQNCGYNKEIKILGIHHIDRDRNNNNLNNLAVLCPNCHSLEHMKHISH